MENLLKKSRNFLIRTLLAIATLCLLLLVVVQAFLLVAINMLNTGKAKNYIQAQLTEVMATSGQNATFDKIFYDPVRGFTVYDLRMSDRDGVYLTADRISADLAFSKMPLRQLSVIMSANHVDLSRLPVSTDVDSPEQSAPLQPFEVPAIFFNRFQVPHLSIADLQVGEAVAGQEMSFSPILKLNAHTGNNISIDASLAPHAKQAFGQFPLPDMIEIDGKLTPSTLDLSVGKIEIISADYEMKADGYARLSEGGELNLSLAGAYRDLKKITQDNFESANLNIRISGQYPQPKLQMNGKVVTGLLKEKGLSDITLSADSKGQGADNQTDIKLETSYRNEPIQLDTVLRYAQDNNVHIELIEGTAPHIALQGNGVLNTQNGIVDASIILKADGLSYYKDLVGVEADGNLDVNIIFKPLSEAQSMEVKASANGLVYDTVKLDVADVKLNFPDMQYLWPQSADIKLENLALADSVFLKEVAAAIEDKGAETYYLSISGRGDIIVPASFKGGLHMAPFTDPFPAISDIDLSATLGKSSIFLTGAINAQAVDLRLNTQNFKGSDLPVDLPPAFKDLKINTEVLMTGAPEAPVTNAQLTMNGFDIGKYKTLNLALNAQHKEGNLSVDMNGKGAGIKTLSAEVSFPLNLSLYPFHFAVNEGDALSGNLLAHMDLAAISPLFLVPPQEFAANLNTSADISGTLGSPNINGVLKISNGQFTDEENGIILRDLLIDATFTRDQVALKSLTATDGEKGRMKGRGSLNFAGGVGTDLSVSLEKFHLPASHLADGMVNASISMTNADNAYALKGAVDIEHMDILIPETFQSKIPELNIVDKRQKSATSSPAQAIDLDIKVNAPNQVFVRGWGLDAEFGGDLNVTGNVNSPLINGNLSSKRGRYEEFGKRFTLARANLRFQGEVPPSPYLDIEATTPANDITASVILSGPVKEPKITFSSVPALPQDEVLSQLLFGRDTRKITPFQAVQLAQALRRFSGQGGGGLNPMEMLRSATGLDDISIETNADGETNVGVGKYLTDKVYLEFEKGKAPGSGGANIQIEITPNVNIQSEVGQDAQAGGGIFWKRDY